MEPWITVDKTNITGSDATLSLSQREAEFAIRISGISGDLMNSRMHNSEDALAELGCAHIKTKPNSQILVGGLGMGFTLASALKTVSESATVTVAELIPKVVEWNHGPLGNCAGRPLDDKRTHVYTGDVADLLKSQKIDFDVILLDVDNGPEAMTHSDNEWLYSLKGLKSIYQQLQPEGIVAIWSAKADQIFTSRLKKTGFNVKLRTVRARPGKGSRHTIFLAQKPYRTNKSP